MEEALRGSARQWQTTFDAISDAVSLMDIEGKILRCNKAMANLLGMPFSEIIGSTCYELMHGASERPEECPIMRMLKTHRRESLVLPMGDQWFDVIVDPLQDETGGLIGVVHIITGITERKKMEEALRESEERYKALFERSLDCVYIHDFEGNFIDANPAALNLLGYKKEEILSLNLTSLISQDQISKVLETIEEIKETGSQKEVTEYKLRRKNGEYLYVETKGSVICCDGKPYAVQGVARDITERKKMEAGRECLIKELGAKNAGFFENA